MTVPYQACPVCNGTGKTLADGFTSGVHITCTVCNGAKVIPMHVILNEINSNHLTKKVLIKKVKELESEIEQLVEALNETNKFLPSHISIKANYRFKKNQELINNFKKI